MASGAPSMPLRARVDQGEGAAAETEFSAQNACRSGTSGAYGIGELLAILVDRSCSDLRRRAPFSTPPTLGLGGVMLLLASGLQRHASLHHGVALPGSARFDATVVDGL